MLPACLLVEIGAIKSLAELISITGNIFSTFQHGAAGHKAMAAFPVAAILLAALPNCIPEDGHNLMQIGLTLNLIYICLIIGTGSVFMYLNIL
jgi:hypothetical protein